MKKKILVKGPALSLSGYGEQARFALRSLREHEDKFDIYLQNINWGKTGHSIENNDELRWFNFLIAKTQQYTQQGGKFDISLQVTIPNEFEKIAPVNIGYTAGIETTKIAPQWIEKSRLMDKIIVVSNHSKQVFDSTEYKLQNQQTGQVMDFRNTTPVEVVHFPVKNIQPKQVNLELQTNFNFLSVAQWGPRKNVEATVRAFLEEFSNEENVGLVLKINTAKNCMMDRSICEKRIKQLKNNYPSAKCKIYLLHGNMSEEEMQGLYTHPKIKAIVSTTHGEGFGLPLFEAVCNGLPVIAPKWSGHVDFLLAPVKEDGKEKMRNHFTTIDFDLANVAKEAVWDGVIQADAQWCHVKSYSAKDSMRAVLKNHAMLITKAKKLQEYIKQEFSEEKQKEKFVESILGYSVRKNSLKNIEPKSFNSISFCVSTNGKKEETTKMQIKSILNNIKNNSIKADIIISGVVEPFKKIDSQNIKFVEEIKLAENGGLAALRNKAAESSNSDILVFCDDDIIFEEDWLSRLVEFSSKKYWDVLGNKILLPDGGRYWDRATLNPHSMVDYDHPENDPNLYQTGCFWVIRNTVFSKHKWDSNILYYAEKNGGINEDVEYSKRLISNGYLLSFDSENTVWHLDSKYKEITLSDGRIVCIKNQFEDTFSIKDFSYLKV